MAILHGWLDPSSVFGYQKCLPDWGSNPDSALCKKWLSDRQETEAVLYSVGFGSDKQPALLNISIHTTEMGGGKKKKN